MRTVVALLSLCLPAWAQGISTDFNAGATGWTLDAPAGAPGWAADATPATFPGGVAAAGSSLNYNNGTTYAGNGTGAALSPLIDLAGLTNPIVTFWCNYNTETRGTQYDKRFLQVWNADQSVMLVEWQLASVGYTFNPAAGIAGIGPGPCGEAYVDLETGTPVTSSHVHRIYLSPAWGAVRLRFVFESVDAQRNGYAGWAIDNLAVTSHPTAAPTGWPDIAPDTITTATSPNDGDGFELDTFRRVSGSGFLRWSWGCTNWGSPGVHMIIGNHNQSILHQSFMYFDPGHNHYHMSQYSDFSLWRQQPYGFEKIRRGPKRSFCLTDIEIVGSGVPSISPGCNAAYQAISYRWQDVYGVNTTGQEINPTGLAAGAEYFFVGVIDPLNRLRETNEMNQTDQIRFTMPPAPATGFTAITPADHSNPFPPTTTPLTITDATEGTFQGAEAVQVIGTGFDTTLTPVLYGEGMEVAEAPFYTIVSATEMWVAVPAAITEPVASMDLLRARGDAASFRLIEELPPPPPAPPAAPPATGGGSSSSGGGRCGFVGVEALLLIALLRVLRRS